MIPNFILYSNKEFITFYNCLLIHSLLMPVWTHRICSPLLTTSQLPSGEFFLSWVPAAYLIIPHYLKPQASFSQTRILFCLPSTANVFPYDLLSAHWNLTPETSTFLLVNSRPLWSSSFHWKPPELLGPWVPSLSFWEGDCHSTPNTMCFRCALRPPSSRLHFPAFLAIRRGSPQNVTERMLAATWLGL